MQEVNVLLNSIETVKSFVNTVDKFDNDFFLKFGRYMIDAKSILGVFSCDLSKPLHMIIYSDDKCVLSALDRYIVK